MGKKKKKKKSKSRTSKKKKKSISTTIGPESTIEIRLPPTLWTKVLRLKTADRYTLNETIRSIFDQNERFGINYMLLSESSLTADDLETADDSAEDDDRGHYKLCEGP